MKHYPDNRRDREGRLLAMCGIVHWDGGGPGCPACLCAYLERLKAEYAAVIVAARRPEGMSIDE